MLNIIVSLILVAFVVIVDFYIYKFTEMYIYFRSAEIKEEKETQEGENNADI